MRIPVRCCVACGTYTVPQYHYAAARAADPTITRLAGRGLCRDCHDLHSRLGTLADHERATRSGDDFLGDYRLLRGEGHTRRQIAERLGMTLAAFDQALARARRRGDLPPARRAALRLVHDTEDVAEQGDARTRGVG